MPQKSEFTNFRGWFNLIEVDSELYAKYGKLLHEKYHLPIEKIARIILGLTNKNLILGKEGPFHNLMVETGRELHAHLMINDVSVYAGYVHPTYIHVGSGTASPTVDDWKLQTPWVSGGIYEILTAEILDMSHCRWEAAIASGDSGTLAEAGLFLQNTAPSTNPQADPSQRPFSMLHRAMFVPPIVKSVGTTEVIQYEAIF